MGKPTQYTNLSQGEFIEFIYRVSSHIYDAKGYFAPEGAELVPNIPEAIKEMFEEDMYMKFRKVLQTVLNSDETNKNKELIDSTNINEHQAEVDKLGGRFNAEMIQYLPNEQAGKKYIERINAFKA